jgi:ssDNA-specific exonuclease RecJ
MKEWFKKVTGIKRLEEEKEKLNIEAALAKARAEAAKKEEELAKMTPKERANALGEPYIAVLDTHINKENLRNGFLELDWNDAFVLQLKQQGYGFDGDPDEEIVDRWFRTLCKDIAGEEGVDMTDRGAGYINVKKIAEGKSEVS